MLPHAVYDQINPRAVDSMLIIIAQNNRRFKACVSSELVDKSGYCAAKNLYDYGVKLHVLASYQIGSMPIPERIGLTHAGVNDSKAYELLCHDPKVKQYINFGDRAYPESQHIHTY